MSIADLAAWRTRLSLSQEKAASTLRVNLRTYQRWEAGGVQPPLLAPALRYYELAHILKGFLPS